MAQCWHRNNEIKNSRVLECCFIALRKHPRAVMTAQWNSSLSVLPAARVQFPATAEYFKGFFPGWSHSANPSWASVVAENGSISPQWHHTTCGQRGGRPKSKKALNQPIFGKSSEQNTHSVRPIWPGLEVRFPCTFMYQPLLVGY